MITHVVISFGGSLLMSLALLSVAPDGWTIAQKVAACLTLQFGTGLLILSLRS